MKKLFLLAVLATVSFTNLHSQNVQLHYDLGHSLYKDMGSRTSVTTTVEMFKPDTWGSTYLFTDIDYKGDGAMGAYLYLACEGGDFGKSATCPTVRFLPSYFLS